jgi:hypothetical protein
VILVVFVGGLTVGVVASGLRAGGGPNGFDLLTAAMMLWISHGWLLRTAVALKPGDGVLYWEAPLRSGAISIGAITAVRRRRWSGRVAKIEFLGGRSIIVMQGIDASEFLTQISTHRPDLIS